ncbi:hypothetical protein [Cohnella thailandensis]|uniref:Helicase XPB/Ssl2 N-terminal domain-containing protein n=1 Tax=Cohnella thailandensis TaxID=557557 RepID=A0A841SWP3_9BACL|nr:hypothetical protein [Cohnella thailandensis]MBB6635369.1 hypothetical protein [Cohnella thailandensis]MBP1974749.1 hypothetical protein [Cohnella thailandensis]
MNLAEMLCYADIEQLTRIADTYRCECSSHSKNDLIQSILIAVQRRDVLESRVEDMSVGDIRFLNSLLFDQRASYSLEELTARARTAEPADPGQREREEAPPPPVKNRKKSKASASIEAPPDPDSAARSAIARFKRFGWLFNGFSHQTRFLYHVPEDVRSRLKDALARQFRGKLELRGEPSVYRDERGLAVADMSQVLRFIRDNDTPLTTDSVLYKRQLQQLLDVLSVSEEIPGKSGWRFGYGRRFRDYPDRFSLLYDYGCFKGWLQEQLDRLELSEEGFAYASGEKTIDPADLYRFWLRLYKSPIPNLNILVQWISLLSAEWTTVDSVERILLPFVKEYYYDSASDVLRKRVIGNMMHLGLLRIGETESREAVIRMTPQGRQLIAGVEVGSEDHLSWIGGSFDFG